MACIFFAATSEAKFKAIPTRTNRYKKSPLPYLTDILNDLNQQKILVPKADVLYEDFKNYVNCGLQPMNQIDESIVNQITVIKMFSWLTT